MFLPPAMGGCYGWLLWVVFCFYPLVEPLRVRISHGSESLV